jgi:hypothetical protein
VVGEELLFSEDWATQPLALGEVLRTNAVAPFISGAKVVRHSRKDKLVGTCVNAGWRGGQGRQGFWSPPHGVEGLSCRGDVDELSR